MHPSPRVDIDADGCAALDPPLRQDKNDASAATRSGRQRRKGTAMQETSDRHHVSPEAVGQVSSDPREEGRKQDAGRGFPGFIGTAAGIFSVVLLLLAIFLIVILFVA
jgi:hypothetical protein